MGIDATALEMHYLALDEVLGQLDAEEAAEYLAGLVLLLANEMGNQSRFLELVAVARKAAAE